MKRKEDRNNARGTNSGYDRTQMKVHCFIYFLVAEQLLCSVVTLAQAAAHQRFSVWQTAC